MAGGGQSAFSLWSFVDGTQVSMPLLSLEIQFSNRDELYWVHLNIEHFLILFIDLLQLLIPFTAVQEETPSITSVSRSLVQIYWRVFHVYNREVESQGVYRNLVLYLFHDTFLE